MQQERTAESDPNYANKSMLSASMIGGSGGGMKSHRFSRLAVIEDDKKVKKLQLENQMINERLKAINFEIDKFVKQQMS